MRDRYARLSPWSVEVEGAGSFDAIDDLFADLDRYYGEADTEEADQPQFDILYHLRRALDPTAARSSQEANIVDGRGQLVYGRSRRGTVGPRVDLQYRARQEGQPWFNLEVDLDATQAREHRAGHLAAMTQAYQTWLRRGRRGPNPLDNVASIFATATAPRRRGQPGAITQVQQVRYGGGPGGTVRPILTGTSRPPNPRALQEIARDPIFTRLGSLLTPVSTRRFDAFWEPFAYDAFAY